MRGWPSLALCLGLGLVGLAACGPAAPARGVETSCADACNARAPVR
ncbi:MAG: hypothetical protein ACRENE_28185 [Polyangiaceae bacterium]